METSIWVGNNERHEIKVKLSSLTGKYTILVDGESNTTLLGGAKASKATFIIGHDEKHEIEIRVDGGTFADDLYVLCDGKVIMNQKFS